jgi:hypothetical protein
MALEKLAHDETVVDDKAHIEDSVAPISHRPGETKNEIKDGLNAQETDAGSLDEEEQSIRLVPKVVRELISMDDDPTLPTVTFR